MSFLKNIALKYKVIAESNWFKKTPPKAQSENLNKFIQRVYDVNILADKLETEMEEKGEECSTDFSDDARVGTDVWFKSPKVVKNVEVYHFTNGDPHKLIKDIKDSKFRGTKCLGLPRKFSQSLGFGFLKGDEYTGEYNAEGGGDRQISFIANESVKVWHEIDDNYQIIWDANCVSDLKVVK